MKKHRGRAPAYVGVKCAVEGCDRQAKARGICKTCYQRLRTNGTLLKYERVRNEPGRPIPPLETECTVQGCSKSQYAKGLCKVHHSISLKRETMVGYIPGTTCIKERLTARRLYAEGKKLREIGMIMGVSFEQVRLYITPTRPERAAGLSTCDVCDAVLDHARVVSVKGKPLLRACNACNETLQKAQAAWRRRAMR